MHIEKLELEGAYYIEPNVFDDNRGFFFEWFNIDRYKKITGNDYNVVQFNCSRSTKGVLRGMHYQLNPAAQSKLVSVVKGEIQDVIIDIRRNSKTYGQHYSVVLSEEKKNQLFVPKGFAHGFLVLSEEAEIFYAIDAPYSPDHERSIYYADKSLEVSWMMDKNEIIVSDKDRDALDMGSVENNF